MFWPSSAALPARPPGADGASRAPHLCVSLVAHSISDFLGSAPSGGPWRQLYCRSCHGDFLETHGTMFHGKRLSVERIVRVLACLAEGLGIRATARVVESDANTVLQWLVEAAEHLRAFSAYFLCDLHLEPLQLDELYAGLRARKAGAISDEEAMKRLERSPSWV